MVLLLRRRNREKQKTKKTSRKIYEKHPCARLDFALTWEKKKPDLLKSKPEVRLVLA